MSTPPRMPPALDPRKVRRWGAILWPSFFAAAVATMVFFAIVDPVDLNQISWTTIELSREAGYTLGFFMFWACTAASSTFTALLLQPPVAFDRAELTGGDAP